ncbi:MAG: ribonuclease HII [Saprospiraceae bacterium]|nr:ribonuclease HII [Saprospiraceae bacterium]
MGLRHSFQKKLVEAGCDEAGRGPLAGPVVGAAVILPPNFSHPFLTDSKQLNHKQLQELRPIIEQEALAFGVGFVSPKKIDEINILRASFLAIHKALDQLQVRPEFITMDGNKFQPYQQLPFECVVKGDGKYLNIAAASVLAKTYRDEYMEQLHQKYPIYNWEKNKGYPTLEHRQCIKAHGPCKHHRKSFQLLPAKQGVLFE